MNPTSESHLYICLVVIFTCVEATGLVRNEEKMFLDDIKQNLRKNNDDYIDDTSVASAPTNATFNSTLSDITRRNSKYSTKLIKGSPKVDARNRNASVHEVINRRSNKGVSVQAHANLTPVQPIPMRLKSVFAVTSKSLSTQSKSRSVPTQTPRLSTVSNMQPTPVTIETTPRKEKLMALAKINQLVQKKSKWTKRTATKKQPHPMRVTKERSSSKAAGNIRPVARGSHDEVLQPVRPPPAEILDMAAAKGSQVNIKRLKGRLCHRHVLVPEGPKYDSEGRVYLRAYDGRRGYSLTDSPSLLLPACCNCCRKSVLGCE